MIKNYKWFTLIELTISIFIMIVVIVWLSFTMVSISNDFKNSQLQINLFQDAKDFMIDNFNITYSTWIVLTWTWKYDTLLLYNTKWWIVIWAFLDNDLWYDYVLNSDKTIYSKTNLWYFSVWTWVLNTILTNTWWIYNLKFNTWKLYKKLLINDFSVKSYNTWSLFELNLWAITELKPNFIWVIKSSLPINSKDIIKLNFNF